MSAIDMCGPIVDDLLMLEKGIRIFDVVLNKEVLVISQVLCFLGDNVRSSEVLNHLGSTAIKLCRMCMVCENNDCSIIMCYQTSQASMLGELHTKDLALGHIREIAEQTTRKDKLALQTEYGLRDRYNPLFDLSIDLYKYVHCTY